MRRFQRASGPIVTAAALMLGGLTLSACATRGYVDEQIAGVNSRIAGVEARVNEVGQRADAANAAAQAAASDARNANQRLDQLTPRVDAMEQQAASSMARRRPRN